MIPRRRYDIKLIDFFLYLKSFLSINKEFISKLEKMFNQRVYLKSSGRKALLDACVSLGIKKNDIIVVSDFNLKEMTELLKKEGYIVRYAPCNDLLLLDEKKLPKYLCEAKAILYTHMFSNSNNIEDINLIAKKHNLLLIEDAAHCFHNSIGTYGDASIISLESNKLLSSYGGGILLLKNKFSYHDILSNISFILPFIKRWCEELFIRSFLYKYKQKKIINNNDFNSNYQRINNLLRSQCYSQAQALIALNNLKKLDKKIKIKQEKYEYFKNEIKKQKQVYIFPLKQVYNVVAYAEQAESLRKYLSQKGFDCGIKSEVIDYCHLEQHANHEKLILFPIHEGITLKEIDSLVKHIKDFYD